MEQSHHTSIMKTMRTSFAVTSGGWWKRPRGGIPTSLSSVRNRICTHSLRHTIATTSTLHFDDWIWLSKQDLFFISMVCSQGYHGPFLVGLEMEKTGPTTFLTLPHPMWCPGLSEQNSTMTLTLIMLGYVLLTICNHYISVSWGHGGSFCYIIYKIVCLCLILTLCS